MTEMRKGELYIFAEMITLGFFPILSVLALSALPGIFALAWVSFSCSMFLACVITYKGLWWQMYSLQFWKYISVVAVSIGIIYYGLYFWGLEYTTPGNASIIALFEVFTSFVLFNLIRKEHISFEEKIGAIFMVLGAFIVLAQNFSGFHIGDFLVLTATIFAPIGNMYQQKARKIASSEAILFGRTILSSVILFVGCIIFGNTVSFESVIDVMPVLIINGILIFALSKIFWIEAIHRMSVTKAMSLNSLSPFVTVVFAWIILAQMPTIWQIISLPFSIAGVFLLTGQWRLKF